MDINLYGLSGRPTAIYTCLIHNNFYLFQSANNMHGRKKLKVKEQLILLMLGDQISAALQSKKIDFVIIVRGFLIDVNRKRVPQNWKPKK